jgi:hypothetical protein
LSDTDKEYLKRVEDLTPEAMEKELNGMTKEDKAKYEALNREVADYTSTMTPEDKAAYKTFEPKAVNQDAVVKGPADASTKPAAGNNTKPADVNTKPAAGNNTKPADVNTKPATGDNTYPANNNTKPA